MRTLYSVTALALLLTISVFAHADEGNNRNSGICSSDVQAAVDAEFGAGSGAATTCLTFRDDVGVVYQVNQFCKDGTCTAPYALGNIGNAIKDYENTHGMDRDDYELVAIVHSGGWKLVLNDETANPFKQAVIDLMAKGVKIKFCQNTARKKNVGLADMIAGVTFVTSGVTSIADLQLQGYAMVQP